MDSCNISIAEQNGIKGVRVQIHNKDLFIYPYDLLYGEEFSWEDAMLALKERGLTTFTKMQSYILLYYKDEINKVLKEIDGTPLSSSCWSSTEYSSDNAWSVGFDSGNVSSNNKYFSRCVVRPVIPYKEEISMNNTTPFVSWVDNGKNKGVRVHVGYYDFVIDPKNLSDRDICWRTAMIKAKKQDKVLPSKNELMLMYIFRDRINKYLKNNEGDELSSKSVYWCSENFSSDIGWYISFLNGFTSYNFECNAYSGRAITHFKY